jgi:hypothetical protein
MQFATHWEVEIEIILRRCLLLLLRRWRSVETLEEIIN